MALKAVLDTIDDLDENLKAFYTPTEDGKFRLAVEGLDDNTGLKSALQKEREAAREANRRLRELQSQYEGIDPKLAKDLLDKVSQSEEARLIAEGKVDEVIKSRTERMKAEYEARLQQAQTEAEQAKQRAAKRDSQVLENQIMQAAVEAKVFKNAYEDILLRAKRTFSLSNDDKAVAVGPDGQPVFGKDGSTPLTPKEWLDSLRQSAPHLFEAQASGSGAGNGSSAFSGNAKRSQMTAAEKAAYISKHGQEAYLKLPM